MKPSGEITSLARLMLDRRQYRSARPYILFLGQDCARAAGVPSNLEIARQLFSDPDLAGLYLEDKEEDGDEGLLAAFNEFLGEMTSGQRYRMLQTYYASVPVPAFYQDLAMLVKAGFFNHILTTNIDTLLEQALNGAGLWPGKDYQVLSLGGSEMPAWQARKSPVSEEMEILVVKLHGDIAQQQVAITPDEISDALEPQRYFVKGELSGDVVMVGYRFESEPLTKWLSWVPGELWWVSVEPPDEDRLEAIEDSRSVQSIHGEAAPPGMFFTQLAYLLLRARAAQERFSPEESGVIPAASKGLEEGPAGEAEFLSGLPDEEISDVEYLQSQLRRSQAVLHSLERSVMPGESNIQMQSQIEYQRRQVMQLEDQLRNLADNREEVVDLMARVKDAVQQADIDPNATSFVEVQLQSVLNEYHREQPNQSIVSAAIGATVVMAERLGNKVVEADLVNRLASYAPSAFRRL